jgi:hypothetical protein
LPGSLAVTTTLSCNGNATLGVADSDSHIVNGYLAATKNITTAGGLRMTGDNPSLGGPAGLEFYMYAGEAYVHGYNRDTAAWLPVHVHGSSVKLDVSGGTIVTVSTTDVSVTGNVDVSGVYKVDGTQVVSNQGAAVADATDAASAITQLNAALARLRAHGLIAT